MYRNTLIGAILLVAAAAGRLAYCASPAGPNSRLSPVAYRLPGIGAAPSDLPGLENVARVSRELYSGGVPEGDPGFETLQRLGIRTIVSVDGMEPDLERARKHGMRCVHLP